MYFDGCKSWIWRTLNHVINIFNKLNFHSASNKGIYLQKKIKIGSQDQKYQVVVQFCKIGNFQCGTFAPMHGIEKCYRKASISSNVKLPFSKNIHGMTQWPPNPELKYLFLH